MDTSDKTLDEHHVMNEQGDKCTDDTSSHQQDKEGSVEPEPREEECIELKHLKYKSMMQGGARKDIGGTAKGDSMNTLDKFLEETTATNKTDRWNKLDKTTKLQKMTEFADMYALENGYAEEEKASLLLYLRDCLDKKKLARVKDVEYDNETDSLIAIPGLQYNKAARKHTIKNLDAKRASVLKSLPQRKTVKIKRDTTAAAAAAAAATDNK